MFVHNIYKFLFFYIHTYIPLFFIIFFFLFLCFIYASTCLQFDKSICRLDLPITPGLVLRSPSGTSSMTSPSTLSRHRYFFRDSQVFRLVHLSDLPISPYGLSFASPSICPSIRLQSYPGWGAGAGCFWLLWAGAALSRSRSKNNTRSRSRLGKKSEAGAAWRKSQKPEPLKNLPAPQPCL